MNPPGRPKGEFRSARHKGGPESGHPEINVGSATRQGEGDGSTGRALARGAAALACGAVFGLGLAVAQMVDPRKVLAFLDLTGAWDASLLFVLGAAVMVAGSGFALLRRRTKPLLDIGFHPPAATALDAPLIVGSALFGIGWGLAGYCPGPAIASLGFANAEALWFVPALLAGTALRRRTAERR